MVSSGAVRWWELSIHNSTPELFRVQLREAIKQVEYKVPEKRIVFIKSWNEWAEGNYLEPDEIFGNQLGDLIKSILK